MGEWYDSQKKPNGGLRKLLRERIDKANTRRKELTVEEKKRLAKLKEITERLKRRENVHNRQLQTWLSEEEYEKIATEWDAQKQFRDELKDKPEELKRYEDKLKGAIFYYNRAEGYSSKRKHTTAKKFYNKSDSLCEDALEILQEIVSADPNLQIWFDRNLDFGHGSSIDANVGNLPRLVTSRSIEKQRNDIRLY